MGYLNEYDVLHQSQSGFRSGHSTETALTLMTERWINAINDGNIIGTIMVDFRKAFDLVDHSSKKYLVFINAANNLLSLWSHLRQRTQIVSINGHMSSASEVTCGVPQGSVLGP